MGGPPFTPQIVIPGWTAGGVRELWVSKNPPRRTHIHVIIKLKPTENVFCNPKPQDIGAEEYICNWFY